MTDNAITRGTGNVFADLGLPEPTERHTKTRLANDFELATTKAKSRGGR
jgi:hypothetical protein